MSEKTNNSKFNMKFKKSLESKPEADCGNKQLDPANPPNCNIDIARQTYKYKLVPIHKKK